MHSPLSIESLSLGCLLGGAVGDALGAPIEFMSLQEIHETFGPAGILDYAPAYDRIGAITDDTQMTLFTAEGLLRAAVREAAGDICNTAGSLHRSYLRWFCTQGGTPPIDVTRDGWLIGIKELWSRRAPGTTCLNALRDTVVAGARADNDSKGCGTVMRTAPIGMAVPRADVFGLAASASRLTHGHPTATDSAGCLSVIIAALMGHRSLTVALNLAERELCQQAENDETRRAVTAARSLARSGPPCAQQIEQLGSGWTAEEALAIGIYATLATSDFESAVRLAVNHSGDSDSTGAIAGNIAGALYGVEAIPRSWLDKLELREEITTVAYDLMDLRVLKTMGAGIAAERPPSFIPDRPATQSRYPG